MTKTKIGEAVSAGVGLAMGLSAAQQLSQTMKPTERKVKQVIVCMICGYKNPSENKFCGNCGQALYPPPPVQCSTCGVAMSSNMNFCGKCGTQLKKIRKSRKTRE